MPGCPHVETIQTLTFNGLINMSLSHIDNQILHAVTSLQYLLLFA